MGYLPQGIGDEYTRRNLNTVRARKHFRAGAKAAWDEGYQNADGVWDLDAAEARYARNNPVSGEWAVDLFSAGWAWSASN